MYENLDKLREEVKRLEKRIEYDTGRLKAAKTKLLRAEHSCIVANVKAFNLTPEQLAEVLRQITGGQTGVVMSESATGDYDEQEDESDYKDSEKEEFEDEEN